MRRRSPQLLLAVLVSLVVCGCVPRRDHTELLRGIATKQMKLEPKITRAPGLELRVPQNYHSDWTANANYDAFIILDPDDESDVQHGMLVVNITPAPVNHIADTLETRRVRSMLAGRTIEWRERSYVDGDGVRVHQREAIREGLFRMFKDPKSGRELVMQIFVVGSDSVLVERLMGAAETISTGGGEPDA
jgi:hypothetical protein